MASRFVLPHFLSSHECKELEFVHKSCGVVGYRPFVLSTTMSHLVATNCGNLIVPMLSVRERVKEVVEEKFGREYELFVEFTGLISWTKGANIGWHSDDNRDYLQQRHYSAVCYLNDYEQDFKGGLFHFQEGEPSTIIPSVGTLVIYTADERNIHCVDEITDGERCTLALWFTLDILHDEDQKLIRMLSTTPLDLPLCISQQDLERGSCQAVPQLSSRHPNPASSVMYDVLNVKVTTFDQHLESADDPRALPLHEPASDDLRITRLASMGFVCCFTSTSVGDQNDSPVGLIYNQKKVPHMFSNSLEALQVAQFHYLRSTMWGLTSAIGGWPLEDNGVQQIMCDGDSLLSQTGDGIGLCSSRASTTRQDAVCSCHATSSSDAWQSTADKGDTDKAIVAVNCSLRKRHDIDLSDFLQSIREWDMYASNLWTKLLELFPLWKTSGALLSQI